MCELTPDANRVRPKFYFALQLDRTPLHYAHLFMENPDTLNLMTKQGAEPKLFDAVSRTLS